MARDGAGPGARLCPSIGVSNFSGEELQLLLATATVAPVVDQAQFSPYEYRRALSIVRRERDALEAYSPLGTADTSPATRRADRGAAGRTPAQVLLRWCFERASR